MNKLRLKKMPLIAIVVMMMLLAGSIALGMTTSLGFASVNNKGSIAGIGDYYADGELSDGNMTGDGENSSTGDARPAAYSEVVIEWGELDLTYNGLPQAPTASILKGLDPEHVDLVTVVVENLKNARDVGIDYHATAKLVINEKLPGDYYTILEESKNTYYNIIQAPITIAWNTSFVYNGENQSATIETITGAVNGESVTATVTGTGMNVGTYTSTAALDAAWSANYKITNGATTQFEITRVPLTVVWTVGTYTYNGMEQFPSGTATGMLDGEDDAVQFNDIFYGGNNKDAGTQMTGATCDTYYDHYYIASGEDCAYTIEAAPITVTWNSELSFVFNFAKQAPTIKSVSGAVNGETVTATVTGAERAGGGRTPQLQL